MSERSIRRARERQVERAEKRGGTLGRKVALASGAALGATAVFAPAAQADNIVVDSLEDDGTDTTLRDAIIEANGNAEPDVITFQAGLTGTIELVSDLEIVDEELEIQGPGASVITVDGQGGDNVFYLFSFDEPDTPVTISGLTVTGGDDTDGGGIESGPGTDEPAELTLADMVITGNDASDDGGGVFVNGGSLTITNSVISDNDADGGGGGVYTYDSGGGDESDVVIEGTTVSGNDAGYRGGGLYLHPGGTVLLRNSTFTGNSAGGYGGGLMLYGQDDVGDATLDGLTVTGNEADRGGGGLQLWGTDGTLTVQNSTVSGNTADADGNDSGSGGGIYSYNRHDEQTPRVIRNSTVVGNSADEGGGIYHYGRSNEEGEDILPISSTIVADNSATEEGPDLGENDPQEGFIELGFSLIENLGDDATVTESPAGTNVFGQDPQLGPIQSNGGPTQPHRPAASSPAIDAGIANGLATDQRGAPRTFDAVAVENAPGSDGTDTGSVEVQPGEGGLPGNAECKGQVVPKIDGTAGN
ncbi:MAG: choice-of-anchor Q domain-containing protein, partial [Acidimicrobiales bacterium]